MNDCQFCAIIAHLSDQEIVWQDEQFVAFLAMRCQNPGHILVIPKQHIDYFFDLSAEAFADIFRVAYHLQPKLKAATNAVRIGLVVEGFGIAHAHLHMVPIYNRFELDPARAHELTPEVRDAMVERLQQAFAE
jgi:histidine triad (HIT) family protein